MQYGHFDDENREYVITRPDTPRPWSNYIGSAQFGAVVTNNAAGYTFYRSAAQGRLSRFRFNGPAADQPGKLVYLRDRETGEFWSNSWLPVGKPLERFAYRCRFGAGYCIITSTYGEIESEVTYFVPPGALYEVWRVRVGNRGGRRRALDIFPFLEPQCNWNAHDDGTNLQYTQYIARTTRGPGMIDIGSNVNMPVDPANFQNKDQKRHTFFGLCGAEEVGFDADLTAFLGVYGTYAAPRAVVAGRCADSLAAGDNPAAAFQVGLALAPGETREFALVFGVGEGEKEGRVAQAAMAVPGAIDGALGAVRAHWAARLGTLWVETPDAEFNSMANLWAPYNNLMTFYWARTASLVYAGERDGLGYRDAVQDLVGSSALIPDESRERLELLLTGQLANGGALALVKPFAHRPGTAPEPRHYRADDCLWLFNAVPQFVKETGDLGFYRQVLPFADRGEATVLGHLRRALEFNLARCGVHGLPCGLAADWNDCLVLGETGESVFVAFQLRLGLAEYIDICGRLGEAAEAGWAAPELAKLDAILERHAWDGAWYLRAYRQDGFKFGSRESEEGSIFMNPQSWAVLSGHATGERARQAMDEMDRQLATEYGIMLCTPPYVTTDPQIVKARLMNPGMKENGGIFNHTQGWAVMAAAKLGLNERAWKYLKAALPSSFNGRAEVREVEPYVVCQSTHSRFSPRFGAGRVSWLSGSAVWNYYAMTDTILGIKPHYDGLQIAPCIPDEWPGFTVKRRFRGCMFTVAVTNRGGGREVTKLTINGTAVAGDLLPAALFRPENRVEVELGG